MPKTENLIAMGKLTRHVRMCGLTVLFSFFLVRSLEQACSDHLKYHLFLSWFTLLLYHVSMLPGID
jgi:hypothetical protein